MIQPVIIHEMSIESRKKFMPWLRDKWGKQLVRRGLPVLRPRVEEVNTREKMVRYIRIQYGWMVRQYDDENPEVITYELMFRSLFSNKYKPGKKPRKCIPYYDSEFRCIKERCKFFDICSIKDRHQKGWSCLYNRRKIWNWKPRCRLILERIPQKEYPNDFRYTLIMNRLHWLKWMKKENETKVKQKRMDYDYEESEDEDEDYRHTEEVGDDSRD